MGLLDDAIEETSKRNYPRCSVSAMDPDLRAEVEEALDAVTEGRITAVALSKALEGRDVRLSATTLNRHRRRVCSCEPG